MDTIGTKEEELLSYGRATIVADIMFAGFFGLSLLELCLFLIYNYFVSNFSCYFNHYKFDIFIQLHPWKEIIKEQKEDTSDADEQSDIPITENNINKKTVAGEVIELNESQSDPNEASIITDENTMKLSKIESSIQV